MATMTTTEVETEIPTTTNGGDGFHYLGINPPLQACQNLLFESLGPSLGRGFRLISGLWPSAKVEIL